jgi:hypothetical protein
MQELPAEFKRLQQETQQLLEEFQTYNKTSFSHLLIHWKMMTQHGHIKELYRKG